MLLKCTCIRVSNPPLPPSITSVKRHKTSHKELYLLLFTYTGTMQVERCLHSLSHPLIHFPPWSSVSLPPTTHHLLRPIITRSTSLFCSYHGNSYVGHSTGSRVARGHQSATDHHHLLHQNKRNQSFVSCLMDTQRDDSVWHGWSSLKTLNSLLALMWLKWNEQQLLILFSVQNGHPDHCTEERNTRVSGNETKSTGKILHSL